MSATETIVWEGAEALRPFLVQIDEFEPFPGNPRRGDVNAVRASLRRFGQVRPILVDGERIVAGHHVRLGAKEEGWTHVAAIPNDFKSEDEARAYLVADNRISELGTNDRELLLAQLDTIRESTDDGLVGTGYDQSAYDDIRASVEQDNTEEPPPDEAPPVPEEPESKEGEIYELGPHRLLCGDARDPEAVARLLDGNAIDLLWTDPPYGVAYADKNEFLNQLDRGNRIQEEIVGDHLTPEEIVVLWQAVFTAARPHMTPGRSFYVSGPGDSLLELLMQTLRDAGFPMRQMIIWAKDQFVLGRRDYHGQHEPVVYGWVEGAAHRFWGRAGESTLWEIPRPRASKLHPTMKPVELVSRSLRNSSRKGEVVFDPFAGSGTTLIASDWLGRRCFAAELTPGYCDVIRQRYAEFVEAKENMQWSAPHAEQPAA